MGTGFYGSNDPTNGVVSSIETEADSGSRHPLNVNKRKFVDYARLFPAIAAELRFRELKDAAATRAKLLALRMPRLGPSTHVCPDAERTRGASISWSVPLEVYSLPLKSPDIFFSTKLCY